VHDEWIQGVCSYTSAVARSSQWRRFRDVIGFEQVGVERECPHPHQKRSWRGSCLLPFPENYFFTFKMTDFVKVEWFS